jgi:metal-responsive CopG/Arc/MetJ family transcriptional regulator
MKTAISLDDGLLKQADETARLMGLSRSRLFSVALEDFLRRRHQEQMIEQLNQVYSDDKPNEARTVKRMKDKFRATVKDRW